MKSSRHKRRKRDRSRKRYHSSDDSSRGSTISNDSSKKIEECTKRESQPKQDQIKKAPQLPSPPPQQTEGLQPNNPKPNTRQMVPMTREEYEKQQNTVREVYDPESGRYRLIRGTGEIIERIVSRSDHERINKLATRGDGMSFARHVGNAATQLKRR